jgi:hypothetical protein
MQNEQGRGPRGPGGPMGPGGSVGIAGPVGAKGDKGDKGTVRLRRTGLISLSLAARDSWSVARNFEEI